MFHSCFFYQMFFYNTIHMKKYVLFSAMSLLALMVRAQLPEDALRTSWFTQNGTARNMATGGAMGSLGGDITANNVNPAGIGLFKTNELVLSPGFGLNNNKFDFRGDNSQSKRNNFPGNHRLLLCC